jgi:hypothetical protein
VCCLICKTSLHTIWGFYKRKQMMNTSAHGAVYIKILRRFLKPKA